MADEKKQENGDRINKPQAAIIAKEIGVNGRGIILKTLPELKLFAQTVIDSGLAPSHFRKDSQVLIAIQMGAELGFTPMKALQSIAVINNRPSIWGDAALALVKASGLCEYIKETIEGEGENMIATCRSKRKGEPDEVITTFSVDDAKEADLWKKAGTWQTYPKRMLQYRARGFNLRDNFPDVLSGFHITEELENIIPLSQNTPQVPKREERKQVDNQEIEVKDSQDVIEVEYNRLFVKFRDMLLEAGKIIKDDEALQGYFVKFITYCFRDIKPEDLAKPEIYTLKFLADIAAQLEVPLPMGVLEDIPNAQKDDIQAEAQKAFKF